MASICPRCEQTAVEQVAESPVKGKWEIYLCHTCYFTWRSTEPESITAPGKYKKNFKIDPQKIDTLPVVPPIPERKV